MDVETIVGVGLAVRLPTGQYMDDKLINLGENRFVFRPQVGVLHTRNHWTVEGTAEVAFHTDNDDFFNGKKLEQKPLYILYGNLSYTLAKQASGNQESLSFRPAWMILVFRWC